MDFCTTRRRAPLRARPLRASGAALALAALAGGAAAQVGVERFCEPGHYNARLEVFGSATLDPHDPHEYLTLYAVGGEVLKGAGLFLFGDLQTPPAPFGHGSLCVAGRAGLYRVPITGGMGTYPSSPLDTHGLQAAYLWLMEPWLDEAFAQVLLGSTWCVQYVYRVDGDWDLTDGLAIRFGPPSPLGPVEDVAQGSVSHHPLAANGGLMVVADKQGWRDFWALHTQDLDAVPPAVDFSQGMVLVAFAGTQPTGGYTIWIREVAGSVNTLYVHTVLQSPGDRCPVLQALTQPYHLVTIPRVEGGRIGPWRRSVVPDPPCR